MFLGTMKGFKVGVDIVRNLTVLQCKPSNIKVLSMSQAHYIHVTCSRTFRLAFKLRDIVMTLLCVNLFDTKNWVVNYYTEIVFQPISAKNISKLFSLHFPFVDKCGYKHKIPASSWGFLVQPLNISHSQSLPLQHKKW